MATLSSAHFVDSDISGTASGGDSWQSEQDSDATFYNVPFDGGDENNKIAIGSSIETPAFIFANDTDCVALWDFDTWATLADDDIGGNTLTKQSLVEGTSDESVDYKQGTGCVNLIKTSDYLDITDANLDSGFPFKSGDTTKIISVTAWVKIDVLDDASTYFAKYRTDNKRSFSLGIYEDGGTMRFAARQGHTNGTTWDWLVDDQVTVGINKWYHVGFTYTDSTRAWKFRIWDEDAATAYSSSGTAAEQIWVDSAPLYIGRFGNGGQYDGKIDQVAVFKDILTNDEIDLIRTSEYPQKTGYCTSITYDDASTGDITYVLDAGSTQFVDDDDITDTTNSIVVNGTPSETTGVLTQDRTTAYLQDWAHLEGQSVAILDNGVVVTGR
ncbi:MAG: LamG domain-containing protein, partial [Planctomycetota bacterium]